MHRASIEHEIIRRYAGSPDPLIQRFVLNLATRPLNQPEPEPNNSAEDLDHGKAKRRTRTD